MAESASGPTVEEETLEQLQHHQAAPLWEAVTNLVVTDRSKLEPRMWNGGELIKLSQEVEQGITREEINQTLFETRAIVPETDENMGSLLPSIFVGIQSFPPGDEATPHQHPHFAPRFVVDGHGGMRADIGGESFPAKTHDLIITPSWEWHAHYNEGDETATWLSFLDLAFVLNGLGVTEENHDDDRPLRLKPDGYYNEAHGTLRPSIDKGEYAELAPSDDVARSARAGTPNTEPHRFAWEDAYASLKSAEENENGYDPYNGVCMEYVNPATGQPPVSPTISLRLQLLNEGEETKAHKHNAVEVFYVIQGSGRTEVGDKEFEWEAQDFFTVPSMAPHSHEAFDDETIMFAASDLPIMSAVNLYREMEVPSNGA